MITLIPNGFAFNGFLIQQRDRFISKGIRVGDKLNWKSGSLWQLLHQRLNNPMVLHATLNHNTNLMGDLDHMTSTISSERSDD